MIKKVVMQAPFPSAFPPKAQDGVLAAEPQPAVYLTDLNLVLMTIQY